jgi:hypothetical protein
VTAEHMHVHGPRIELTGAASEVGVRWCLWLVNEPTMGFTAVDHQTLPWVNARPVESLP